MWFRAGARFSERAREGRVLLASKSCNEAEVFKQILVTLELLSTVQVSTWCAVSCALGSHFCDPVRASLARRPRRLARLGEYFFGFGFLCVFRHRTYRRTMATTCCYLRLVLLVFLGRCSSVPLCFVAWSFLDAHGLCVVWRSFLAHFAWLCLCFFLASACFSVIVVESADYYVDSTSMLIWPNCGASAKSACPSLLPLVQVCACVSRNTHSSLPLSLPSTLSPLPPSLPIFSTL
jgi:hypothetical protein